MISRVETTQWVKRIATETELHPGTHTVERENQLPPISCPPPSTCVPWYTHSCAFTHSWVAKYIFKEVLLPPVILDPSFPLRSYPQTQTSSPGMARPRPSPARAPDAPPPSCPHLGISHILQMSVATSALQPLLGHPLEALLDPDRSLQHHLMALRPWSLCERPLCCYQYLPHGLQALHNKK